MQLVLIAEDEYGTVELLELILEAAGYRVVAASNGRAGLEALAGEKPAVILSDFMMPHLTGGEFGLAVRANPAWADIPFVMISATREEVVAETFSDYDAFVSKPYAAEQLLALVAHFAANGRDRPGHERRTAEAERELQRLMRGLRMGRP